MSLDLQSRFQVLSLHCCRSGEHASIRRIRVRQGNAGVPTTHICLSCWWIIHLGRSWYSWVFAHTEWYPVILFYTRYLKRWNPDSSLTNGGFSWIFHVSTLNCSCRTLLCVTLIDTQNLVFKVFSGARFLPNCLSNFGKSMEHMAFRMLSEHLGHQK